MDNTTQNSRGESNFSGVAGALLLLTVGIFSGIYLGGNATPQKVASVGSFSQTGAISSATRTIGYTVDQNNKIVTRTYSLITKNDVKTVTTIDKKTGKSILDMVAIGNLAKSLGGAIALAPIVVDGSTEYGLECWEGTGGAQQCWCDWPGGDAQQGPDSNYGDMEACLDWIWITA